MYSCVFVLNVIQSKRYVVLNKGKPLNKSRESECRNARYAQHQNEICYAISLKWVSDSTQYCIVTPASNRVWENLPIFAIDNLVQSVTHTFITMFLIRVVHILRIHFFTKNASNYSKSTIYKTRIPLTRSFITVFPQKIIFSWNIRCSIGKFCKHRFYFHDPDTYI